MPETEQKKTPVKLRPIKRIHAGKITEPYRIMENLIKECSEFNELKDASIRIYFRQDWVPDVDGIGIGAMAAKASESERLLAEEAKETIDLKILLPSDAWPTLDDLEKEHRIYHELCHFAQAKDSNGDQKYDTKDRPLWRLKRHPIAAFPSEIDRFGIDKIIGHNEKIVESIAHAVRPMEKIFDQSENGEKTDWRKTSIDKIGLKSSDAIKLIESDVKTTGQLQKRMTDEGTWWAKGVKGIGEAAKERIEEIFNRYVIDCENVNK